MVRDGQTDQALYVDFLDHVASVVCGVFSTLDEAVEEVGLRIIKA